MTSKPQFITLTGDGGLKFGVNRDHVSRYWQAHGSSKIEIAGGVMWCAETIEQVAALLGVTGGDQPIETAPKDGTEVLLWGRHAVTGEVGWIISRWCPSVLGMPHWDKVLAPSRWMPLPAPPAIASATGTTGEGA